MTRQRLDLNFVLRTDDLVPKYIGANDLSVQILQLKKLALEIRNGTKAGWAPAVREWCPPPAGRRKVDALRAGWLDWVARAERELDADISCDTIISEAME